MALAAGAVAEDAAVAGDHGDGAEEVRHVAGHDQRGDEAERDDIDFNDMSFAHWGMAMTARMIANAVDHKAEIGPARYMGWCSVPLMRPDKVFVLQLTSGQFSAAREALGDAAKTRGVASALAEFINRQFVGSYADAAVLVAAERSGSTVLKGPAAIVMVYGPDLVICTWNSNELESAFVISSESVSAAMDADAIRKSTADIGIVDPEIRAYEGEALDRLLTLNPEVHGESPSLHMWGLGEVSDEISRTAGRQSFAPSKIFFRLKQRGCSLCFPAHSENVTAGLSLCHMVTYYCICNRFYA